MSVKEDLYAVADTKRYPIPDDMRERVQDLSKPTITHLDTLEILLVGASELQNPEHYDYIQKLIGIENSLEKKEAFKKLAEVSENIKAQFQIEPSKGVQDYIEAQKKASAKLNEQFKPLIDATNVLREQMLKTALPNFTLPEALTKVTDILQQQHSDAIKLWDFQKTKADELKVKIAEGKEGAEKEEYKAELLKVKDRMVVLMNVIKPLEPMYVTKFSRKTYNKEMKPLELRTSPKYEKLYLKETTEKVFKALWKYWKDNLPLGDTRKTYFHKLADEHKLSFSRIEQIENQFRPTSFKPKR